MEDDKDLVPVAAFDTEHEAKILQIALIDRGIRATISGDVTAFGGISGGATSVRIYVRRIETEEAQKVIRQMRDETELCPAWQCSCGETVDEGFAICWACGAEYANNNAG